MRKSKSTKRITQRPSVPVQSVQESSTYAEMFENQNDNEEEDEFVKVADIFFLIIIIKDATPGPGYYYNPSTTSSFRTKASTTVRTKRSESERSGSQSNRERNSQPIRNMNERFYERPSAACELGPGEYEIFSDFMKRVIIA